MSEHTPTPWRNDQKPDALIVCDAEGGSIADCAPPGPWMSHKVALANAAFIVRAVNEHEEVTAEIKRLRERLGPRGLEVVFIDGAGHYVNEKVKAEIERLRAVVGELPK